VVPASSNTLAEIAHGLGDNLISRAAAVTLKERRRLVIVHREMPLSPIDVTNYKALSDAGVILAPANPGFYLNPTTVLEVAAFVARRAHPPRAPTPAGVAAGGRRYWAGIKTTGATSNSASGAHAGTEEPRARWYHATPDGFGAAARSSSLVEKPMFVAGAVAH